MKGIEKITYGDFPGTDAGGVVGYQVELTGESFGSPDNLARLITTLTDAKFRGKNRVVAFHGLFTEENQGEMFALCQTLKDYDFFLKATCDGSQYFTWFKLLDFLVTRVTNTLTWLRFASHQIIYVPVDKMVKEPKLPPIDGTALYIDPKNLKKQEILDFFKNAKYRWNLRANTSPLLRVTITTGPEEEEDGEDERLPSV